jgi:hypothetical protein
MLVMTVDKEISHVRIRVIKMIAASHPDHLEARIARMYKTSGTQVPSHLPNLPAARAGQKDRE